MSALGALILSMAGITLLGGLALWLLNVPLWMIASLAAIAWWAARWLLRRSQRRKRPRQEAESGG